MGSPVPPPSSDGFAPPSTYEEIQKTDQNRSAVFNESREIYKGSPLCSVKKPVIKYVLISSARRSEGFRRPVPGSGEAAGGNHKNLRDNNPDRFRKARLSDLKVLLNVSPPVGGKAFCSNGADSAKTLAWWIATDWDAARLFL